MGRHTGQTPGILMTSNTSTAPLRVPVALIVLILMKSSMKGKYRK